MKLERHVGGLSLVRKANYLRARGWREDEGGWSSEIFGLHPMAKAVHHQLTDDLSQALRERGWMEQKSDLPDGPHTVALEAKNITTGGGGSCYFQRARLLLTAR